MVNKYTKVISALSDEDLIQVVTSMRDDYEAAALAAAKFEIKKRNISYSIDKPKEDEYLYGDNPFVADYSLTLDSLNTLVEEGPSDKIYNYADHASVGSGTRFNNYIIDKIAIFLISIIFLALVLFLPFVKQKGIIIIIFIFTINIASASFFYYLIMELIFNKTIGKFITKTIVVKQDGSKPSIGSIIGRTLCRHVPFNEISFYYGKRGFHDILSGTAVVKDIEHFHPIPILDKLEN